MTTNPTQPAVFELFSMLPPELREKVYHYHLVVPEPIRMDARKEPSFFKSHIANCGTNSHSADHRTGILKCIKPSSGERQQIRCPPSRLALLATCKTIYDEAVRIFYRKNHFTFETVSKLQDFVTDCQSRYRFMEEISFRFCYFKGTSDVFRGLRDCHNLRILRIKFDHRLTSYWGRTSLVRAGGMTMLRKLRGVKTLELSGRDVIETDEGNFQEVDVQDPRAIGPILQRELTRPRK